MSDTASIPTTAEERAEWREIMRDLNDGDNAFMRLLADVERLEGLLDAAEPVCNAAISLSALHGQRWMEVLTYHDARTKRFKDKTREQLEAIFKAEGELFKAALAWAKRTGAARRIDIDGESS